jgi:acetyl-CoA carboxylase biotin carboxylase subunit
MKKIKKILIANRGEIAIRVMRTCKEMSIQTVAIYSEQDKYAPHVQYADEAYLCGAAPASESYLRGERVIDIALKSNADAIHPGYGFLSEKEDFVEAVTNKGLIFIGPSATTIKMMGDKTAARSLAQSINIPIVPGVVEPIQSFEEAKAIAKGIGYPILLKAAGGGGGKGMRVVQAETELQSNLRSAMSEAQSTFGDSRVYIEKYITNPRHIEVQILADSYGNVVHLGERECSIQRRHQKIIEESPSVAIDQRLRDKITEAAIKLCKESRYVNAGTLEFLLDEKKNFYFLEMNTRLQVEHPVTEMRTGLDLVREQISIASGGKLSFTQGEIQFSGHAVECRIYAEDSDNNFFPSTGIIQHLKSPAGPYIREDRGVEEDNVISPYYDPLIAKLISWGKSREQAITRMIRALKEYEIYGVKNNISLCLWAIGHPNFNSGKFDTTFLQKYFTIDKISQVSDDEVQASVVLAALMEESDHSPQSAEEGYNLDSRQWAQQRNENMR